MINNLLNNLYSQNIQIKVNVNNNLKITCQNNTLTTLQQQQIKDNKQKLVNRLQENEMARQKGFMIYGHGDLYEYRYGYGAYIFIERHSNGFATAWRANYRKDGDKPFKVKMIARNKRFQAAFKEAAGFIDWLRKKNA